MLEVLQVRVDVKGEAMHGDPSLYPDPDCLLVCSWGAEQKKRTERKLVSEAQQGESFLPRAWSNVNDNTPTCI